MSHKLKLILKEKGFLAAMIVSTCGFTERRNVRRFVVETHHGRIMKYGDRLIHTLAGYTTSVNQTASIHSVTRETHRLLVELGTDLSVYYS